MNDEVSYWIESAIDEHLDNLYPGTKIDSPKRRRIKANWLRNKSTIPVEIVWRALELATTIP